MAYVPTTVGGYSSGARVLQSPTAYTGAAQPRMMQAAAQPRMVQSAQAARPVTTVQAGGARPMAAKVISTGSQGLQGARVVSGGYAPQATYSTGLAGTRTMVAGSAAPRIVQSSRIVGQANVVSGGISAQPNTIAGPGYTQAAYEVKHKDDPQLQNLKELRQTCGLKNIPVNDALQALKAAAVDGQLAREGFQAAYINLLQQFQVEVPADAVRNAVFDLFDRDDNGVVDMMELICGASLLCTGSEEDKIHAVFNIFDENGDGDISMDEMFKFLTSVFKVVLTPNVMGVMNSMGVTVESPEDLASVTALECFKTADLNHDGKLSVAEFKNWFFAPRNDPSFLFSPVRKLLQ